MVSCRCCAWGFGPCAVVRGPDAVLKAVRRLYWALPPALLAILFSRIDVGRFLQLARHVDAALVLAGMGLSLGIVATGALRWHLLVRSHRDLRPTWGASLVSYWRCLSMGALTPGSLGADALRVMALGRQTRRFVEAAWLLLTEKAAALLACVVLLIVLLPAHLPPPWGLPGPSTTAVITPFGLVVGVAALMTVLGLAMMAWRPRFRSASRRLRAWAIRLGRRVDRLRPTTKGASRAVSHPRSSRPVLSGTLLGLVGLVSVAVFVLSAAQAHLFFAAIGHPVSYAVNLCVTPLLFLVFAVPISFGTLGVREVAFVVLYGAFGVPAEQALLVSFLGLCALLSSHAVGALLWWVRPDTSADPRAGAERTPA